MSETAQAYLILLALVALERCFELALSIRNRRRALAAGGIEVGRSHYPWMVVVHTLFLASCAVELVALARPFRALLALVMCTALAASMALRYWAIATLGERWNTRVVVIPGAPAIAAGPYRFLRHPNYVAVVIEMFALPLVHGAWITAIVFSALNAAVLFVRIRVEEAALREHCDYDRRLPSSRIASTPEEAAR